MKAIAEIAKECLDLSSSQRMKLARFLLDVSDTDEEASPGADAAWEEEIGARFDAVKDGTARAISVAEVFTDLDRRFPS